LEEEAGQIISRNTYNFVFGVNTAIGILEKENGHNNKGQ